MCATRNDLRDNLCDDSGDCFYHQDIRGWDWQLPASSWTALLALAVVLVLGYQLLYALDFDLLPLHQLFWNILVYLMPERLLEGLDIGSDAPETSGDVSVPHSHAAKSAAMRRVLGLDKPGGLFTSMVQVGRVGLSSIPMVGTQKHTREDTRPAGLGNWDNSCYQNSVLQGLASLAPVFTYLRNPLATREGDDASESVVTTPVSDSLQTTNALRQLLQDLNDPRNNGQRLWTPSVLKSMSSWQQQDAQEYFSKILDEIDKEVNKAARSIKPKQGLHMESADSKSFPSQHHRNPVHNPLEGLIAQRVGCMSCGFTEGLSMIPFNCLTIPLGKSWEHQLSESLDAYTELEMIPGVECTKCTLLKHRHLLETLLGRITGTAKNDVIQQTTHDRLAAVEAALEDEHFDEKTLTQKCSVQAKSRVTSTKSRQAVIARPPQSLVIHINRSLFDEYTGDLRKNYSELRFPKMLDLGPWCLGSIEAGDATGIEEWNLDPARSMIAKAARKGWQHGPLYEIRGVVSHYGGHENGHYICHKRAPRGAAMDISSNTQHQWWRISDDVVEESSEREMLGQGGVFMLFYDRIEEASFIPKQHFNAVDNRLAMASTLQNLIDPVKIPLPEDTGTDSETESCASENGSNKAKFEQVTDPRARHAPAEAIQKTPIFTPTTGRIPERHDDEVDLASPGLVMV